MPTEQELREMGDFNKPYMENGIILHADGFASSKHGARVYYSKDGPPTVKNGPFGFENLVAGFWILKLNSFEEAVEFAKKAPFKDGSVEVRKVFGLEDFGDELPKDMKDRMEKESASA